MSNDIITQHEAFKWYDRSKANLKRDVEIIERFIACKDDIDILAIRYELTYCQVSAIISRYFESPETNLKLLSNV